MKKKMMLLVVLAACLSVLFGCGTAESKVTTVATTEAPITDPTTEPTTEPTEPPTLFEKLGLELWEDFKTSSTIYSWEDGKEFIHTEGHAEGLKGFMRVELQADNQKWIIRELVDTNVDVVIHENTYLEHEMDFIMEKFRDTYCDAIGQRLADEEWMEVCENYKILDVKMDLVQEVGHYYEELLTAKKKKWDGDNWINGLALVDVNTGMVYSPTSQNDDYNLAGVFRSNQETGEKLILALADKDYSVDCMQFNLPKRMNYSQSVIFMLPENYEGMAVRWGECIKAYTDEEYNTIQGNEEVGEMGWKSQLIQEADEVNSKYYYFSTIHPLN